jgi:hypothetical protein
VRWASRDKSVAAAAKKTIRDIARSEVYPKGMVLSTIRLTYPLPALRLDAAQGGQVVLHLRTRMEYL